MSTTVADYLPRTADLLLYAGLEPTASTPGLAAGSWELITGIEKAIGRFLLILLTPSGSSKLRPRRGTEFWADARRGGWRTTVDVSQSYVVAAAEALRQCRALERADDPDDERLTTVDLLGVSIASGRVALRLSVRTVAGDAREYIAPIPIPVRG